MKRGSQFGKGSRASTGSDVSDLLLSVDQGGTKSTHLRVTSPPTSVFTVEDVTAWLDVTGLFSGVTAFFPIFCSRYLRLSYVRSPWKQPEDGWNFGLTSHNMLTSLPSWATNKLFFLIIIKAIC